MALVAATLLAVGLSLTPAGTRVAAAATGQLLISAAATYTVDPDAAVVRVSVAATYVNDKPSDASFFYYWRDLSLAVHPESANIQVRDGSGPLRVTPVAEEGFIDARFRLRRDLLYRQSIGLTITWDLPGGAPRSASTVRVGQAFAAFDLWAWGDGGTSSVAATLPPGFVAEAFGSEVRTSSGPAGVTISAASITDPVNFWTSVTAVRERSLAEDELTLPGDIELLVKGWPEDRLWRTTVSSMLRRGLPRLQELIGLPWPVDERLEVTEVYAPLLEGYAGLFYTDEQRIEISEELDDITILHEGAHAWFNDTLFVGRWIGEGLAETYATAVLGELTGARHDPERPRTSDDGEVDLDAWTFPGRVTDETDARETYGYNASWYVVDELYDEIGAERMREVLAVAAADTIAYVGSPSPETVTPTDTWRRFLDLLVEVGGSQRAEALFRDYVTDPTGDRA
ncbi:MAG TPA: hypothetical protein VFX65_05590, partial [Candidatus Limnocylindrales bacterium]|nr:hypothetical protein [Candidatus Limnocylindrales bacterium]